MNNSQFKKKIIIGTAQFGMNYGIANISGKPNQQQVDSILNYAWNNNINGLDTAKGYGGSEVVIGRYLRGNSNQIWDIITKINENPQKTISQIRESTKNLSIHPNTILAHSIEMFFNDSFYNNALKLKQEGQINSIGVSLYTENEINKVIISKKYKPDIIQIPLNILDTRLYHNDILNKLSDLNIEIHARSVFLQGLFYLDKTIIKKYFNDAFSSIVKLKLIAKESNLSLPELSLLWLLNLEKINKVIIGIDNLDQLIGHIKTTEKIVNSNVYKDALNIKYKNEKVLTPNYWNL